MRKLLKKKVNVFGKAVPVFVIAILAMGLVSAALITSWGVITGTVTLTQGLTLNSQNWDGEVITYNAQFTSLEEERVSSGVNTLENTAGVEALVNLNTACTSTVEDGCDNIATNYVSTDDVIATADRLVLLQNTDGGWDWIVTGLVDGAGGTSANIVGVTAQGLLTAYEITGTAGYLDAAKHAGDYLITKYGTDATSATMFGTTGRINAFDIKFLYDLGSFEENSVYTTLADALMTKVIEDYSTGSALLTANVNYRGTTYGSGIAMWDLYNYVECAETFGNPVWASELATAIGTFTLSTDDSTNIIGLAGIILATGKAEAVTALIAKQSTEGYFTNIIWPNEKIQPTAYAIMALMSAGEYVDALEAQIWLAKQSDIGVWLEDSAEISEVDSEAIQALPSMTLPIIVGGTETVKFTISSYFPKMMKPAVYTITTEVLPA